MPWLEEVARREAERLGLRYDSIGVRDPRTRWGSCSRRGHLSFSWRLVIAPAEVLEYVVVHELCHLREPSHSRAFWRLLETARPGWQEQARWLRANGQELHDYEVAAALGPFSQETRLHRTGGTAEPPKKPGSFTEPDVVDSAVDMPERALLMLADIVGYTEFMRLHRLNLAHSQEITQRLLESMLDAVPALRLVEVEGDALFMSAPQDELGESEGSSGWLPSALAMYRAFHAQQQWMVAHNLCVCDACRQIGRLHVKFVAHLGEVVPQRIRDTEKLVGVDVIVVHRMLKNTVAAAEYVLMSEPLYRRLEPHLRDRTIRVEQELEGLGEMPLYFVELGALPIELPALPAPTLPARLRETIGFGLRAFPRLIGLRGGTRSPNRPIPRARTQRRQ